MALLSAQDHKQEVPPFRNAAAYVAIMKGKPLPEGGSKKRKTCDAFDFSATQYPPPPDSKKRRNSKQKDPFLLGAIMEKKLQATKGKATHKPKPVKKKIKAQESKADIPEKPGAKFQENSDASSDSTSSESSSSSSSKSSSSSPSASKATEKKPEVPEPSLDTPLYHQFYARGADRKD